MPKRHRGVLDVYPQAVHKEALAAIGLGTADVVTNGTFTETEWTVPVIINLEHATLMEVGRVTCDLLHPLVTKAQAGIAASTTFQTVLLRTWLMEERRTGVPTADDPATIALFDFWITELMSGANTNAQQLQPVVQGDWKQVLELEDEKTGQGQLIAQRTIYLYTQSYCFGGEATLAPNLYTTRVGLQYRNVGTPSGREFLTKRLAATT